MILESLKYIRYKGEQCAWTLSGKDDNPVYFLNTNLIVGKNAAGKTRSLVVIRDIANIMSMQKKVADLKHSDWECDLTFKENDDIYGYHIIVKDRFIEKEILSLNGEEKFNRKESKIYSELAQQFKEISLPREKIVISLKENQEDYPYLAELYEWGSALKRFTFTNQLDKDHLQTKEEFDTLNTTHSENTIQLFYEGRNLFGDNFIESIISDMKRLDYSATQISLVESADGIGISVQEDELFEATLQTEMSQGMFRALSFIINLNFALFSKVSVCLLIDDLGEGLDFSRSKSIIDLLIYKINNSDIQVFITTNDRYVMNTISIKYWSVLERIAKSSVFYNYLNSKDIFEDFKYTGLNNFDFLASEFYLNGFQDDDDKNSF